MFFWKSCVAVASTATALLVTTAAQADDTPPAIVVGAAQAEAVPEKADAVSDEKSLKFKKIPGDVLINDVEFTKPQSDYWIGLFALRPSPALQAQLEVAQGPGPACRRVATGEPGD